MGMSYFLGKKTVTVPLFLWGNIANSVFWYQNNDK